MDILRIDSLDGYALLLERLYGFYAPGEAALAAHPLTADGRAPSRRKLPLLARDLAALGRPGDPPSAEPPPLTSTGHAFGCRYVLEGATLGGQIISRHLRERLGLTAETGAAFFHGYGPETGRMWKAFGAHLCGRVASGDCAEEDVIAGACDTFVRYEAWVCDGLSTIGASARAGAAGTHG